MKGFLVASLIAAALFAIASPAAWANDPIDCTNGCTIVTCSGNWCTVWRCDSGGCIIVGGYERRQQERKQASSSALLRQPAAFNAVCEYPGNTPCAIKVCDGAECVISLFDGKSFTPVGRVDNIEHLLKSASQRLNRD